MKTIFVYNPESGRGKVKRNLNYLLTTLSPKFGQIDVFETRAAGDATRIAKEMGANYDYFLLAGGDGTLNEAVNGLAELENKPIIGYLPSGTVNDVAHSLGLPKSLKKAAKALLSGDAIDMDIFKVNDSYGVYVCCSGLFTSNSYSTNRAAKKRLGKAAYFLNGVKDVFGAKPIKLKAHIGGEEYSLNAAIMLIINSRSVAGFMLNKSANLCDGLVDVVIVKAGEKRVSLPQILRCTNLFTLGLKRKSSKNVLFFQTSSIKVETDAVINIDGEKGFIGGFDLSVIKGGIKIIANTTKNNGQKAQKVPKK